MKDLAFSPSDRTDKLGKVADEFYTNVLFDEEPLFVSDEATVWGIWSGDEQEILDRCSKFYGVPVSKCETQLPFWKFVTLLNRKRSTRPANATMKSQVRAELWISWASMLRSYAAAHGLNSNNFAVIEFGTDEIVIRVGGRWTRFTHDQQESSDGLTSAFALNEDGSVTLNGTMDEMDFAAERITRELMR